MNCLRDCVQTKKCSKCGNALDISEFRKDKSKPDGLYSSCSNCYRIKYGQKKRNNLGFWRGKPIYLSGLYHCVGGERIHRIIAQEKLGRDLLQNEVVHHINENKYDNRLENIEILDRKVHLKKHSDERLIDWGQKTNEELVKLYYSGIGVFRLSKMFGLNKSSILRRFHKWKIEMRESRNCQKCHWEEAEKDKDKTEALFKRLR